MRVREDGGDRAAMYHRRRLPYDVLFRLVTLGRGPRLHDALVRTIGDARDVVDLGCGTGALLEKISTALPAARCVGVDFSQPLVDAARHRLAPLDVTVECADAQTWNGDDGDGFDVAVFCLALSTFADPRGAIRNAAGLLRPGGRLVVAEPVLGHRKLADAYTLLKAPLVRSSPRLPIEAWMRDEFGSTDEQVLFRGLYTILVGRRP